MIKGFNQKIRKTKNHSNEINTFSCNSRKNRIKICSVSNFSGISKKSMTIIFNIIFFNVFSLKYINNNNFENDYNHIEYDLVIPLHMNDTEKLLRQKDLFKKYLNYSNLIIIIPKNSNEINQQNSIIFIKEDDLIPKEDLINIFYKRGIKEINRVGWYEQQFLKMSYSRICDKEYYLLWDADTIPIRPIKMFDKGVPIFDMKKEKHFPYFITLERLIPGLHFTKFSYISEHMIIKTEYMRNILDIIENNVIIPGKMFWEKILASIDQTDILNSGFSEYETYGTYVDNIYPNAYKHRMWSSKRNMVHFFGNIDNLIFQDIKWLSKDYYAISFEKWDTFEKNYLKIVTNSELQNKCRPKRFFKYFKRIYKKYSRL